MNKNERETDRTRSNQLCVGETLCDAAIIFGTGPFESEGIRDVLTQAGAMPDKVIGQLLKPGLRHLTEEDAKALCDAIARTGLDTAIGYFFKRCIEERLRRAS